MTDDKGKPTRAEIQASVDEAKTLAFDYLECHFTDEFQKIMIEGVVPSKIYTLINSKGDSAYIPLNTMTHPITITQQEDGVWHISYFGKLAGWVQRVQRKVGRGLAYRCLTVGGDITYTDSMCAAKDWVVGRVW
jgi:hypothetical protein